MNAFHSSEGIILANKKLAL